MLYEALFVPEGQSPFPESIIDQPEIAKYIGQWGTRNKDLALVCEERGELIGAIWARAFPVSNPGYGFIDEQTPELSMAVKSTFRGQGIGTNLIQELIRAYQILGVKALSLSVDKLNPAQKLYEKLGFKIYKEEGTAFTMLKII